MPEEPGTPPFQSPDEAANAAYGDFINNYKERLAITLKENWDKGNSNKKTPSDADFEKWTNELIRTHDHFTYKDDSGQEQKVTLDMMQIGVDASPRAQKKLDGEFKTHKLSDVVLNEEQLNGAATQVSHAVHENRGEFSLFKGATLGAVIMGFLEWMMEGFSGSLTDAIAKQSVDGVTQSAGGLLAKNEPTINAGVREAIVDNVNKAAQVQAGLANPEAKRSLQSTVTGSALAHTAMFTPTKEGVQSISPKDTVRVSSEIQNGLDSVSLINFADAQPKGKMGPADHVKIASYIFKDNKAISFYNDKTKKYEVLTENSPAQLSAAIANDASKRVGILTIDDQGKQETKYFEQVAHMGRDDDGNKSGAAGSIWREIDANGVLLGKDGKPQEANAKSTYHASFPGYTDSYSPFIIGEDSKQRSSMIEVTKGELSKQTLDSAKFMHAFIQKTGAGNIEAFITGSHSLGASNALAARTVCDAEGVKCETTLLIEPAGATLAARKINKELSDKKGDFYKQLLALGISPGAISKLHEDFNKDTVSLRVTYKDENGQEHDTKVAGLVPLPEGKALENPNPIIAGFARSMAPGADPSIDNGTLGRTIKIAAPDGLNNPSLDGHFEPTIENALLKGNAMYEIAQHGRTLSQANAVHDVGAQKQDGGAANVSAGLGPQAPQQR